MIAGQEASRDGIQSLFSVAVGQTLEGGAGGEHGLNESCACVIEGVARSQQGEELGAIASGPGKGSPRSPDSGIPSGAEGHGQAHRAGGCTIHQDHMIFGMGRAQEGELICQKPGDPGVASVAGQCAGGGSVCPGQSRPRPAGKGKHRTVSLLGKLDDLLG